MSHAFCTLDTDELEVLSEALIVQASDCIEFAQTFSEDTSPGVIRTNAKRLLLIDDLHRRAREGLAAKEST